MMDFDCVWWGFAGAIGSSDCAAMGIKLSSESTTNSTTTPSGSSDGSYGELD